MITFAYPGYNPTTFITMRDPDKNDPKRSLSEVFVHATKGGQYKSNISKSCIGEYERILTFSALCSAEKEEFLQFILGGYGEYIKYTDYKGINWITQITNDVVTLENSPAGWNITLNLLVWEAP
mgnify:CR=1 FL=1